MEPVQPEPVEPVELIKPEPVKPEPAVTGTGGNRVWARTEPNRTAAIMKTRFKQISLSQSLKSK